MRHLNYNHLLYFWTVAREGSVARAAEVLHLTPQTISGQLKLLEETVGVPLFQRAGRGLAITDTGRLVQQYADEIFSLGAELSQRIKSRQPGAPVAFNVGVVNAMPKSIACRLLAPALQLEDQVRVVCVENDLEVLLGDLAVHRLDLILADRPIPPGLNVRAYNHDLGGSAVGLFASEAMADHLRRDFPRSLNGAPMLMPLAATLLRRQLDEWFEQQGVVPRIVAEFDDSALMKAFGARGLGLFPSPVAAADEVAGSYGAALIGVAGRLREQFHAISPERKVRHPAVICIIDNARHGFLQLPDS